jgi:small subunit ribosomal protein S6
MRPYEVMVIFDPGLEEDVIRAAVDRFTELLRSRGATVGRVDHWGKRRLAYELRHRHEGVYVLVEASAEPAAMTELDRVLHLADEVIRHKVVRVPDAVVRAPARAAAAEAAVRAAAEASPDANGA